MKITPEEIFDITKYPQNKNKWVTGLLWSDFIDWYKQLIKIVFRLNSNESITFAISDLLTGGFCVELYSQTTLNKIFDRLDKENNKYITESFGVSLWDGVLLFHPKDLESIKYFDTIVKLTKENKNE